MKISIGIPAYNSEKHLRAAVASVLGQTLTNIELVIVNDGSSDSTAAIAQEIASVDSRVRTFSQENCGLAATRNRIYSEMSPDAEYVLFLDHDDVLEPDALEILCSALEASSGAVAAYGLPRFIDNSGKLMENHPVPGYEPGQRLRVSGGRVVSLDQVAPTDFAVLAAGDSIVTPGMVLMRKSCFEQAGKWDADVRIKGCDDLDLWFRMTLIGPIVFVNEHVLRYRLHDTNMSGNVKMMRRSERFVRRKILALTTALPERRQELQVGYRHKELKIARDKIAYSIKMCSRLRIVEAIRQLSYGLAHMLRGYRGLSV